ncbi:hypothetical protein [Shewanella acanthi]|uniref:hypothetical protein n=1 Tax=Shewanella acanthi TaxID=2864212 RepID=UPI001C660C7C|nr:hypothetical protein [Shewanella acanthi]QYJ80627.1 hypothetical protein K0H61_10895 [Shewanella acanthi]
MHHQYFNEPMLLDVGQTSILTLTLPVHVSDFSLLQAIGAPLLELIVVSIGDKPQIAVRFQPLFAFKIHPSSDVTVQPNQTLIENSVVRGVGQGVRLYNRMGTAPKFYTQELREGLSLNIDIGQGLSIALNQGAKFELITLESDVRSTQEPKVLTLAKALLARKYDYDVSAETIAVYLAEIEQIRLELQAFWRGELGVCHQGLASDAMKLEPLLQQKRQWLYRTYTHLFERSSYGRASNDGHDIDQAMRKLQCFELLASPELSEMVERLMEDEV